MTFMRRPRVFLSYRHEERRGWLLGQRTNARHRAWVNDFANALASWNVDVVWDDRLREMFKPHTKEDPSRVPFLAEVSTLCLQVAQTFMPVLTRGYVERIAGASGGSGSSGYGTVSEEWRHGLAAHAAKRCDVVTIVREWPITGWSVPPPPIEADSSWDFRFVAATRAEVEMLGDVLNGLWDVERPHFDMPFREMISAYLKFCTQIYDLPWPGIERWGCDFDRPRVFIDGMTRPKVRHAPSADAGSQRDLNEAATSLGIPKISAAELGADREPIDPEKERKSTEQAKDLVRSVLQGHAEQFRKPFDFSSNAPGGRASRGLYFGPTLPGYSHLHPADPGFPG